MSWVRKSDPIVYDSWLLYSVSALLLIGLLIVASSSMAISNQLYGHPLRFLLHQCLHVGLGLICTFVVVRVPLSFWSEMSGKMLIVAFVLLCLVLVPGVGAHVKGSARWLRAGIFLFQVSEYVKLVMVIYLAGYLVRRYDEVRFELIGFLKPLALVAIILGLLLLEPDFGAGAVILMVVLSMLFLAGVQLKQFIVLLGICMVVLAVIALSAPYRLHRMTSFLNPWASEFGGGYQLTQSLIAFGRGGLWGTGLGNSVQKLFYLPEAHTDFLFAVLAEELGLLGVGFVLWCYTVFWVRCLRLGAMAQGAGKLFPAYLAYGLGLWMGLQALINIGVTIGLLPTKGLTLPFMSYGGSSMLIDCVVWGLLLRISYESRNHHIAVIAP